jgi:hypothetical protein
MDSSNIGYLQPGHWIPQPLPAHDVIYIYINQFLKQINLENFFEKRKEGRRPSP